MFPCVFLLLLFSRQLSDIDTIYQDFLNWGLLVLCNSTGSAITN